LSAQVTNKFSSGIVTLLRVVKLPFIENVCENALAILDLA
jgi:hypothetical protein